MFKSKVPQLSRRKYMLIAMTKFYSEKHHGRHRIFARTEIFDTSKESSSVYIAEYIEASQAWVKRHIESYSECSVLMHTIKLDKSKIVIESNSDNHSVSHVKTIIDTELLSILSRRNVFEELEDGPSIEKISAKIFAEEGTIEQKVDRLNAEYSAAMANYIPPVY